MHDVGDGGFFAVGGLNDEMGMGMHDAVAVEFEVMFLPVVGEDAEK
jgi:hypothetical protein